jgi:hypothetical protein
MLEQPSQGLLPAAGSDEQGSPIGVVGGAARVHLDGGFDQSNTGLGVATLVRQQATQMQRVRMLRIAREHPCVGLLSLGQLSPLVMLQAGLKERTDNVGRLICGHGSRILGFT